MYARDVNDRTLTFVVSGMLWNRSLVMMDLETKSLWSHILGEAMRGPLEGTTLEMLPSAMTDWKTWRTKHPRTTVAMLSRTSRQYQREFYRDPSQFVVAMAEGETATAWPFDQLQKQPVVNAAFNKDPVLVVFEQRSSTAFVYDRRADDRELQFVLRDGKLLDAETASTWDWATGRATAGPLKGTQLKPLPGVVSFRRMWLTFHPETEIWRRAQQ